MELHIAQKFFQMELHIAQKFFQFDNVYQQMNK